jgi:hypothetical protein
MSLSSRLALLRRDPEILITVGLLCAVVVIGLATVGDYSITIDEFNADDFGQKALAWYASGFTDRSLFTEVEQTLWYYGPWFHILTAWAQSLGLAPHWAVRHALTFLFGLAGIAMLLPIGRLAAGRWAGLVAVTLCLTTGYLYGSLFFTPIDIPFLFVMTAATLGIMVMARRAVPLWPASLCAGALTGLAIATRSSGFITQAYLIGATGLCAIQILCGGRASRLRNLARLALRTAAALVVGWAVTYCLWPWLQIGNPLQQFLEAFRYFANHPAAWNLPHWGETVRSNELPWSYVPGQLFARLPLAFLLLLLTGLVARIVTLAITLRDSCNGLADRKTRYEAAGALFSAPARQALIVWGAALVPILFVIVDGSTLYNGIRHVIFIIPMLAVVAGYAFVLILPWLKRVPVVSSAAIAAYLGYQIYILAALHPLEYIAFNALAGGVQGAYQRFDMDYWGAAGDIALKRLEHRMDLQFGPGQPNPPPKLTICIPWREPYLAPMYGRPWTLETDPAQAEYVIATEPARTCEKAAPVKLIDEVTRFGRPFAWTYARIPEAAERSAQPPR